MRGDGERAPSDFFERLAPFGTAFMALFGRKSLPHRSSLSRFLADVDRPCVEAFRTLFEKYSEASEWTTETSGGIFDQQGRRSIVFDVDATRQAARKPALPRDTALPPAKRRLEAVCAPGYDFPQARGGGPHTHHGEASAYAKIWSARMQVEAMETIAMSLPQRGVPSQPT